MQTTPSPITGGAVTTSPTAAFQRKRPDVVSSAYRNPSLLPMTAKSPETAGEDAMPNPVSYFQRTSPVVVFIAYNQKSSEPMRSRSPAWAGDESMPLPVGVLHIVFPDEGSRLYTLPSPHPRYSCCSAA